MNKSVSAYAPKGKTFCTTDSLKVRVSVAGAIQVKGYEYTWDNIFTRSNLKMNQALQAVLQTMDDRKGRKREVANTKLGKRKRSAAKYEKTYSLKFDSCVIIKSTYMRLLINIGIGSKTRLVIPTSSR